MVVKMKFKKTLIILSALFMLLVCVSSVSASDDVNDTVLADDETPVLDSIDDAEILSNESESANDEPVQTNQSASDNTSTASSENTTTTDSKATDKTDAWGLCSNAFIQKSNKYFTVKVCTFNEKKNKLEFHKNVKLIVKVKIGKKTKTYNVKTNKNGEAKILNVKNLKVGTYKVSVKSNDAKYNVNQKGYLGIFKKKTKTITLKMDKYKKVKGDIIITFYEPKNAQNPKGVYATNFNAKDIDGVSHCLIIKAKFFFKNKKTGKIITKTCKSKTNKIYGWDYPYFKPIKGYTPIKTKIWYSTCA